ncbi:acid-sensing ion channel 1A-like [Dysidea avara]|uniref:acid-sensing ion channel 1A-like n=1 Tax=Dysidea avara TaxID=196820 RepID=UPI0033231A2C
MTDKSVDLEWVTTATEDGAVAGTKHYNSDTLVKCSPIKPTPIHFRQGDSVSEWSSICEDARQDEKTIIASGKRCHSINCSRDLLNDVPLSDSEKELASSCKVKVWRTLFTFFSNTSFHGLPHIAGNRRSWARLTYWIIALHLSLFIMLAAIYFVTAQYTEMKTVLFSKQCSHKSLQLPAITICNVNMYRRSVASETNLDLNDLTTFFNLISDDPWLKTTIDIDAYFDEHADVFGIRNSPLFLNHSGHQLENMLINCQLDGQLCGRANFTKTSSINGNCYTFNTGESRLIGRGRRAGLSLVLNAEEYEYFLVESDSIGFNIFIHHPDHFPYYDAVGSFSIPTGQLTRVALNTVNYKLSTTSQGGQCEDNINLKYFKTYGQESCLAECVTNFVVNMCNCKPEYLPGPAKVCMLSDFCQYNALKLYDMKQCHCPLACEYSLYTKTLSYATFPATHFASILNTTTSAVGAPDFLVSTTVDENGTEEEYLNRNFTESFLSKNIARVSIYFDSLTTTTMEEGLEYSTEQFLVDFGGYIGLFTGAGFLTFFELIDLCINFIRPNKD